jgi:hypothetical protein
VSAAQSCDRLCSICAGHVDVYGECDVQVLGASTSPQVTDVVRPLQEHPSGEQPQDDTLTQRHLHGAVQPLCRRRLQRRRTTATLDGKMLIMLMLILRAAA